MSGFWRPPPLHYIEHSHDGGLEVERNFTSESLGDEKMAGQKSARSTFLQYTSTITIANAKISPALLTAPVPSRISGAVHRAVWPCDMLLRIVFS